MACQSLDQRLSIVAGGTAGGGPSTKGPGWRILGNHIPSQDEREVKRRKQGLQGSRQRRLLVESWRKRGARAKGFRSTTLCPRRPPQRPHRFFPRRQRPSLSYFCSFFSLLFIPALDINLFNDDFKHNHRSNHDDPDHCHSNYDCFNYYHFNYHHFTTISISNPTTTPTTTVISPTTFVGPTTSASARTLTTSSMISRSSVTSPGRSTTLTTSTTPTASVASTCGCLTWEPPLTSVRHEMFSLNSTLSWEHHSRGLDHGERLSRVVEP